MFESRQCRGVSAGEERADLMWTLVTRRLQTHMLHYTRRASLTALRVWFLRNHASRFNTPSAKGCIMDAPSPTPLLACSDPPSTTRPGHVFSGRVESETELQLSNWGIPREITVILSRDSDLRAISRKERICETPRLSSFPICRTQVLCRPRVC